MSDRKTASKSRKLSYKIGFMILLTQVIVFLALGIFYVTRFTNQLDSGINQKFSTPGYLMSKGMLRYQTVQDKETMENLVGETIDHCMIIGANGKVYYALNQEYQDKKVSEISLLSSFDDLSTQAKENIFIEQKKEGNIFLYTLSPLRLSDGKFLGYLFIESRMERVIAEKREITFIFVISSILSILLTSVTIILMFNKWFAHKIENIVDKITELAKGKLVEPLTVTENDEIGVIKNSINQLIKGTESRAHFANEISEGNFSYEYEALSKEDLVGTALVNMRDNLKQAKKLEQERNRENEIQSWVTKGLANFADILRQNNDNIKKLSYSFIVELINYMDANQGALFVLNDDIEDETYFEAAATVAYDRKKVVDKKFKTGEGLIGRAAYEKLTIYMTDVPNNYAKITSGLGTANPKCLLLVPLISENEIMGVIEIMSFNEFEPYQIEFVEKIAVNIASTLINVKVNERTGKLVSESQQQREELQAQEEEVRQNLEEMTAIKEEAVRQQEELSSLWNTIKGENYVAIYDQNGELSESNSAFDSIFGSLSGTGIKNMKHILEACTNKEVYLNFIKNMEHGKSQTINLEIKIGEQSKRFVQSHLPMRDAHGTISKFMSIAMPIE